MTTETAGNLAASFSEAQGGSLSEHEDQAAAGGAASQVGERLRSLIEDAETAAAAIRSEAEEEARRKVTDAEANAERIRTEAEGAARELRDAAALEAEARRKSAADDASRVRQEAEADARRELEDARRRAEALAGERARGIEELADAVQSGAQPVLAQLERAEELRETLDGLVRTMRDAARRLKEEDFAALREPSSPSLEALDRAAGEASVRRLREEETGQETEAMASARLVALQLAVEGRPRDEVAGHLREHFGIEDSTEILDDVFSGAAAIGQRPAEG